MPMRTLIALAAAFAAVVPALAQDQGIETIQAPMIGASGAVIGQVLIRGSANATVVRILLRPGSLTPGWHGLHFHSVGDCSDPGRFQLARGHVNHLAKKHGLLNPDGPDEGDLPNIYAAPDGSVNAEVSTLVLRILGQKGLKDEDGTALVVQADEDDHVSQPTGAAVERVACAAIR
jgi:Cu-Zn family superoxide dismutase